MQISQDFPGGFDHSGLMIGDAALLAECFNNFSRFSLLVARHHWEKMVLNLIVKPSIPEVNEGIRFDIAAG